MTPDPLSADREKSRLSRGVVYLVLWLVCFAGLLDLASGLLENGLVDLFNSERMSERQRMSLGIYLVLSIVFLALGMNSLFRYFRSGASKDG